MFACKTQVLPILTDFNGIQCFAGLGPATEFWKIFLWCLVAVFEVHSIIFYYYSSCMEHSHFKHIHMSKTEMKTNIMGFNRSFQLLFLYVQLWRQSFRTYFWAVSTNTSDEGSVCCVQPVAASAYTGELEGSSHQLVSSFAKTREVSRVLYQQPFVTRYFQCSSKRQL